MGFPANPGNSAQIERNLQLPLLIEVWNNKPCCQAAFRSARSGFLRSQTPSSGANRTATRGRLREGAESYAKEPAIDILL
jgi:hypothetical protein